MATRDSNSNDNSNSNSDSKSSRGAPNRVNIMPATAKVTLTTVASTPTSPTRVIFNTLANYFGICRLFEDSEKYNLQRAIIADFIA